MNHFNSQNLNTSAVNAINISSVINDYESVIWFLYDFLKISDLIFQKSDESREIFMLFDLFVWWLRTYKIDVKSICPNGRSMYTIIDKRGSTWIRVNTEQFGHRRFVENIYNNSFVRDPKNNNRSMQCNLRINLY